MEKNKVKIWIGLGSYLLASVSPLALNAAETAEKSIGNGHTQAVLIAQASAGGEGREGGERGEGGEAGVLAGASPDQAFLASLLMMKGHLRVGRELVGQGQWDGALSHFHHPAEEVYGTIAKDLSERGAKPFKAKLAALSQTVKAKRGGKVFEDAYKTVMTRIDGAIDTVDRDRSSPEFLLSVAFLLLMQAGEEYDEAVAEDKFVDVHEYQDSRGFVWTAEDLISSVPDKFREKDAGAYRDLERLLKELKRAWPSVVPPARPVKTVSEVWGIIFGIEFQMSGLRRRTS